MPKLRREQRAQRDRQQNPHKRHRPPSGKLLAVHFGGKSIAAKQKQREREEFKNA
jgi:hypothetical protein